MLRVLVVEDVLVDRHEIERLVTRELSGYEVGFAVNRDDALIALSGHKPDLILLDLVIAPSSTSHATHSKHGEGVLAAAKRAAPPVSVIITSKLRDSVREYLKIKGADDFLIKQRPHELREVLPLRMEELIGHLACRSASMQRLREEAAGIDHADRVVVIEGQHGSGKAHLASVLHKCSPWRDREPERLAIEPLSEELVELFGRRGGAHEHGLLEAEIGSLYLTGLQHLGSLSAVGQRRLATFLLTGADGDSFEFRPVGSSERMRADLRVIVGTEIPLAELSGSDALTPELRDALCAAPILRVPPPAERLDDVEELLHCFRRSANERHKAQVAAIDEEVIATLTDMVRTSPPDNGWNVVRRAVEDAVARAKSGTLRLSDLRAEALPPQPTPYEVTWARDGGVSHERASELRLRALEAEPWPLVLYTYDAPDESPSRQPVIKRVVLDGTAKTVGNHTAGRLLWLLADRAGEMLCFSPDYAKDADSIHRQLGLHRDSAKTVKDYLHMLRDLLNDRPKRGSHSSRFFETQYGHRCRFRAKVGFLLVRRRADHAKGSPDGNTAD